MKTITITEDRYDELLEKEAFLSALKEVGIDNWEGYDLAYNAYFNSETNDITDKL